ncbi:MAG: prolyl oligopeptidase family serine peptidase [Neptuniibacter sp.]
MKEIDPGFWQSELTEEQAISASIDYSHLQCSEEGDLFWVEQRPDQQGRNLICCYTGGAVRELTADGFSVQSKVHEYGGRSWCLVKDRLAFVNATDQQLYLQSAYKNEKPQQLTKSSLSRFIEPVWDKKRNRLLAVEELHCGKEVINRLVSVDINTGAIQVLHQGYDFYAYPEISASGEYLAFVSWNHPEQPWTSTQLHIAEFDQTGGLFHCEVIAGAEGGEAVSQPCFRAEDQLSYISDRSGWWNIYTCSLNGEVTHHLNVKADMMPAPWQSGLTSYAVTESGLVCVEQLHGGARLKCTDKDLTPSGYTQFRSLSAFGDRVFCVAAGPDKLPQVVSVEKADLEVAVISANPSPLCKSECSSPIPMEFGQKDKSYGYFYPAKNSAYHIETYTPVVVFLHGGPTASAYPVLNPKIQYWTQRGFAVLDLNYRGSSGYGRDYRMALHHKWGEIEIEDIRLSLEQLSKEGRINPDAIFIRGNSSGGYSALNAMCELDCFAGGASLYGVTDPLSLTSATHKFESRYLDWLIGDPETDRARYSELAPINKSEYISCPVIFFQGELDRVVVPEQTRLMINKLQQKQLITEAVFFEDEAHGFRKRDNQIKVLKEELGFYQRVMRAN